MRRECVGWQTPMRPKMKLDCPNLNGGVPNRQGFNSRRAKLALLSQGAGLAGTRQIRSGWEEATATRASTRFAGKVGGDATKHRNQNQAREQVAEVRVREGYVIQVGMQPCRTGG